MEFPAEKNGGKSENEGKWPYFMVIYNNTEKRLAFLKKAFIIEKRT